MNNIHYCVRYNRYIFQKIIDGIKYKKIFRTKLEAERFRHFFYIKLYNGKLDL